MHGTHHHGRRDDHDTEEHDIYYRLTDNDIYVSCHVDFHPDHIITGDDRAADLLRFRAAIDAELGPAANVRVEHEQRRGELEQLRDYLLGCGYPAGASVDIGKLDKFVRSSEYRPL